ncbi:MAG: sugar ABC transporter substrate-binding protein [Candidatus Atribacteria bacterium]
MKIFKGMRRIIFLSLLTLIITCFVCSSIIFSQEKASSKQLTFGMTVRTATPPYARAMILGAEEKAKELGVKIIIVDSHDDVLKQLEQIDNFIAMGVDGFVFGGTIDTAAVIPGIKKLNEHNIPIMALDNCPEGGRVELWISFDIVQSSKKAAEVFVKVLEDKHEKVPKGVVIEITGALGDAFTNECYEGFHAIIDKYNQLTIVQGEGKWNNIDSFERTSDLLMRYGDEVVGIYIHTPDIMGPGVIAAVEQAGYDPKKFAMAGICMGPEGVDLIKKGKISAIVGQPALASGELAVQYLYDLCHGKDIPKIGDTVVEEGALWSPAVILENPRCEGAFMRLQGPLVPLELSPDDPRLWENKLK